MIKEKGGVRKKKGEKGKKEKTNEDIRKKMANIAIGPSKRNFIIIIIPGFASRIV